MLKCLPAGPRSRKLASAPRRADLIAEVPVGDDGIGPVQPLVHDTIPVVQMFRGLGLVGVPVAGIPVGLGVLGIQRGLIGLDVPTRC